MSGPSRRGRGPGQEPAGRAHRRRRSPGGLALVAAAGLALALLLAGCGDPSSGQGSAMTDTRIVAGGGTITTVPVAKRKPAPDVAGRTLSGGHASLVALRGKVVVLNVWGSWCAPCRKEAPELAAAARALEPHGVAFLGVDTRDLSPDPAEAFVRRFAVPYASIYDPKGEQLLGFRTSLPAASIPSTLVIDQDGKVAARVLGPVTALTVEGIVHDTTGITVPAAAEGAR